MDLLEVSVEVIFGDVDELFVDSTQFEIEVEV